MVRVNLDSEANHYEGINSVGCQFLYETNHKSNVKLTEREIVCLTPRQLLDHNCLITTIRHFYLEMQAISCLCTRSELANFAASITTEEHNLADSKPEGFKTTLYLTTLMSDCLITR